MKRLFITTYIVTFKSDKGSIHDRVRRFWIWKAPQFFDWVLETRAIAEKQTNSNLVITFCAKI